MGFGGYEEFREYLHELAMAHATMLELMESTRRGRSGYISHLQTTCDQDITNLKQLRQVTDFKGLRTIARRLHSARKIAIIGSDGATALVFFLGYTLQILGLAATTATTAGQVINNLRTFGPKDVVVGISFGRGLRLTVEGLKQAQEKGTYCVGITDTHFSPVAQHSDYGFLASTESPSYAGSYVAPMAILNLIVVACADYKRARTLAFLKDSDKEHRTGYRWYSPG
jgi:DNA-binding MurR/RpiR family transcriptional regulator